MSAVELFGKMMKAISDQGNAMLSKIMTYFGVGVGIGGGSVQVAAKTVAPQIAETCAPYTPDWLAYAPAVGVLSLVIKNAADIYYKRQEIKMNNKG